MIQGFIINQKRLEALNKTVQIQSRIIANALKIDKKDVYDVVMAYNSVSEYSTNSGKPKNSKTYGSLTKSFVSSIICPSVDNF